MGAWSGRGIPPTRKKLHKARLKLERARTEAMADLASERGIGDREWRRIEKRHEASGVDVTSFWERWVD